MGKYHHIENVTIENGVLSLVVDGTRLQKSLAEISELLANAPESEQQEYEVSPSGYGIHWPLIDEDISVDGLLGVKHEYYSGRKSA